MIFCSCCCGWCFADRLTINCPSPTGRVLAPIYDQKNSVIGLKEFVIELKDFLIKSKDPVILQKSGWLQYWWSLLGWISFARPGLTKLWKTLSISGPILFTWCLIACYCLYSDKGSKEVGPTLVQTLHKSCKIIARSSGYSKVWCLQQMSIN